MYIKNNNANIDSSFLIQNISFEDKKFLETNFCHTSILPLKIKNATGNSATFNKKNAVMACFGEYNERLSMFYNINSKISKIPAFSLFDDSVLNVNPAEVYMNYSLRGLNGYKKIFTDSCGVASHTNSELALYAAILEFVERQSLILTWLSKKRGREYPINLLNNYPESRHLIKRFSSIFSYFKVYDISLYSDIFVILIIGGNKDSFSIGLDANLSFSEALKGALDEFCQSYESILLYQNNPNLNEQELYKRNFLNQTSKEFIQKYTFLEGDITNYYPEKCQNSNLINLKKVIQKVPIDYYALSIPPAISQTNLRIVKVFSPDAFPHMNTQIIDPHKYKIANVFGIQDFPNMGKSIPFP